MKIDFLLSADYISDEKIKDKSVVVIDMLRATSVIVTAIKNNCKNVIPVTTVEEAREIAKRSSEEIILGGERNALKIEGFQCSNSPLEYKKDLVENKTVVMTTSNGTRAIKGCEKARNILIGSMINGKAVAKRLKELDNDVVIVNAGTNGEFSMDDFICGGYITQCLIDIIGKENIKPTDIAMTALYVYNNNKDIKSFIHNAKHYNRMMELGYLDDLEYCCQKDITELVPECIDGKIV